MLLFSFVGLLLLRLDANKLLELLFQEPPRKPRDEPACEARTPYLPLSLPSSYRPLNTERRSP